MVAIFFIVLNFALLLLYLVLCLRSAVLHADFTFEFVFVLLELSMLRLQDLLSWKRSFGVYLRSLG